MSEHSEQISSYLLGELNAEEAAAFERRLEAEPALREEVERLRPVVARVDALPDEAWDPPEPPPLAMPPDAAPAAARGGRRGFRRALGGPVTIRPAFATALSLLLLAIGVGAGSLLGGDGAPAGGEAELALSRIDDGPPGAEGRVFVSAGAGEATLDVSGLEPNGPGRFYELWLLDADGRMIAVGAFRVGGDGRAEVEIPIPVEPSRYQFFDVSLQEDNGDPTHSGVSVLRGPTSAS